MSSDKRFVALRLEGPLQSWGFDSQYNRRNTGLMPTKSGIAGMCCAAIGLPRGSDEEKAFLIEFGKVKMTAIAIPRVGVKKELPVRRMQDYHTVQNTKTAEGKIKDCHITHRQYLTDAAFGVILESDTAFMSRILTALADPKWGIWLGRKTCIPTTPVLAGIKLNRDNLLGLLKENRDDALCLLIGDKPLESFTYQVDVDNFSEGRDSIPDLPLSFATERRVFAPRRVLTHHGRE
jgi:CRISPR system Cascade subunit CasD